MARKALYSSPAEKQKAYRERKRNESAVTNACPYCRNATSFFDVPSGQVTFFGALEQNGGRVFLCLNCNAFISLDEKNRPCMWNIVIKPNLASV